METKRMSLVVALSLALIAVGGCSKWGAPKPQAPAGAGGVAAVVGGDAISMEELEEAAKGALQRFDNEMYQVKRRVLEGMIERKVIEQAAKKKGVNPDKLVNEEVEAKVAAPAEEEVKAFYESNKQVFGKTLEEVRVNIVERLKQMRRAKARGEFLDRLKAEADVRINIEPPRIAVDTKGAPSAGDDDAPVTLIEFSDYQCPFCKRVRPTVWRLMDEYKGKLKYVFMDFPLAFHKDARKAHEAAHCAGDQGKYFEYNKAIFDNQSSIGLEELKRFAKDLKLDMKKFEGCLSGGKHAKRIEASVSKGAEAGVSGTPAYFINGIILSGAMPYDSFKEIIEQELKK